MRDPNVLVYDEATCGVDLIIRYKLKEIMKYYQNKNNMISFYTTHFLKDIEIFCDKITIIQKGNFKYCDFIENLKG